MITPRGVNGYNRMRPYETLVVDVTYRCNSPCAYCRWGSSHTERRADRNLEEVMVPHESLRALGTRRVVLSGGEPLLFPDLAQVLAYYSAVVPERVVISNGLLLDSGLREKLLAAGATGS